LNIDIRGGEEEVDPRFGADREGLSGGSDGRSYHRLDGEPGKRFAVGVEPVVFLRAEPNCLGNVRSGLVGVELDRLPPPSDGGGGRGVVGDGVDELSNDVLLSRVPRAVPDDVDGNVGGEDGAHVVFELHEFG